MIDLDDFGTLCHGTSDAWLCEHLDITPRTLRRWKAGARVPKAVLLLLRYINYGELASIGGKEWEGFTLNAKYHTLDVPCFHRPFEAGQIKAMFFKITDAWINEAEVKNLHRALAEANQRNDYYRDQLKQAGRKFVLHKDF